MKFDPLNDAIVNIKNHEHKGKTQCTITPKSKLITEVLRVFQENDFIKEFEEIEDNKGGTLKVILNHKINDCGVVKPRYPVKHDEYTDWEKQYLPSRGFGVLVVSTPNGVMSHAQAIKEETGGRLIAYVY